MNICNRNNPNSDSIGQKVGIIYMCLLVVGTFGNGIVRLSSVLIRVGSGVLK